MDKIDEFFAWLQPRLDELFNDKDTQLKLGDLLKEFHPSIRWEIGPGLLKKKFLAFSPNLDVPALEITRMLAARAPDLADWEFFPAKPRKRWIRRRCEIKREHDVLDFNFDGWTYYLTKFNDGEFFDVNLIPYGYDNIDRSDLEYAGSLLVEFELGELIYLELIDRVNIVMPSDLAQETNEIRYLYEQLMEEAKGLAKHPSS